MQAVAHHAQSEREAAGLLSHAWVTSSDALGHRPTEPPLSHVS